MFDTGHYINQCCELAVLYAEVFCAHRYYIGDKTSMTSKHNTSGLQVSVSTLYVCACVRACNFDKGL